MLLVLDGPSILYSSFFALLPKNYLNAKTKEERQRAAKNIMQTSSGLYTNAVYITSKILLKILKNQKPNYAAIAWDCPRDQTFRKKIYPQYKAHREKTKPELIDQVPLMQDVCEALGIAQLQEDGFEADDVIGNLAKKFQQEEPVVIMTKDKDALQLVDDRTRLWLLTKKAENLKKKYTQESSLPNNVFEFTPLYVKEVFGVLPEQITDLKALEGDPSDGIPGVKGVGEKTAGPLVREFGNLENIYEHINELDKNALKDIGVSTSCQKKLIQNKDQAFLSKKLATIDTENTKCVQEIFLSDLKIIPDRRTARKMFRELEFESLISALG